MPDFPKGDFRTPVYNRLLADVNKDPLSWNYQNVWEALRQSEVHIHNMKIAGFSKLEKEEEIKPSC